MWLRRGLNAVAVVLALVLFYRLGALWMVRLTHPFDLEWMEGGMLAHAWRLAEGKPLYTEPGPDWIPYIYQPGYAWVVAAISPVFGLGYGPARAVSVLGTVAAAAAVPYITWRQHGKPLPGLIAGIAFLGTYDDTGAFFDLVRTDGLGIGLTAWAVALGMEKDTRLRDLSGLLLFAAFAVKQNFAMLGVPMALGIWRRFGWRDAARFAVASAVPALAWTGWWQWRSGGLYLTYILETPATHGSVGERGFPGTPRELFHAFPVAVAMTMIFLVHRAWEAGHRRAIGVAAVAVVALVAVDQSLPGRPGAWMAEADSAGMGMLGAGAVAALAMTVRSDASWRWVYGAGVGGMLLFSAALMRAHVGGFINVLIPMYWGAAAGAGWVAARWEAGRLAPLAPLLLAGQIGLDLYRLDTDRLLPPPGAVEAGEAVIAAVAEVDGPVYAPFSPWIAYQAGKEPGVHLISIWDVTKRRSPFAGVEVRIEQAIAEHHFGAVVCGNRPLGLGVPRYYDVGQPLHRGQLHPVTGYRAYPIRVCMPRASSDRQPR